MTETKVKNAERVASLERASKVRGREHMNDITAITAEKPTVQISWLVIVLRYLAPVRTWRAWLRLVRGDAGGSERGFKDLDEGIVEEEHDGREVPGYLRIPVQHLTDVADVADFRVSETEFPVSY